MASKVFFADLRTNYRENLQQKLTRLLKTAGMVIGYSLSYFFHLCYTVFTIIL